MNEKQQISAGDQHFPTTDAYLANSLITAGCSYAPAADWGPAQMRFTPDHLRSMWVTRTDPVTGEKVRVTMLPQCPCTPLQFEIAAMRAVKLKNPGIVEYFIVRDTVWREAIAAHDAIVQVWADAARTGAVPVIPNLQTMTEAAMIMTVLYIARQNRETTAAVGWLRSPNLVLSSMKKSLTPIKGASQQALGEMSYKAEGSGKIWSLDLKDEDRMEMGIHPKPKI